LAFASSWKRIKETLAKAKTDAQPAQPFMSSREWQESQQQAQQRVSEPFKASVERSADVSGQHPVEATEAAADSAPQGGPARPAQPPHGPAAGERPEHRPEVIRRAELAKRWILFCALVFILFPLLIAWLSEAIRF
jgi:hypothetical protein